MPSGSVEQDCVVGLVDFSRHGSCLRPKPQPAQACEPLSPSANTGSHLRRDVSCTASRCSLRSTPGRPPCGLPGRGPIIAGVAGGWADERVSQQVPPTRVGRGLQGADRSGRRAAGTRPRRSVMVGSVEQSPVGANAATRLAIRSFRRLGGGDEHAGSSQGATSSARVPACFARPTRLRGAPRLSRAVTPSWYEGTHPMTQAAYNGSHGTCRWTGLVVLEDELHDMTEEITERALDLVQATAVDEHLRDLAETGMSSQWLEQFLTEAQPANPLDWQVGEAIAEALLERDHLITFPWNSRRDERVPRASLPGADLVGLWSDSQASVLVFGEVKSSSDTAHPPSVLVGKSGMVQQLERILADRATQLMLIRWLSARIPEGSLGDKFSDALSRFVNSQGAAIRLVGALMRDTSPEEGDVSGRGRRLGELADSPGIVELYVWYLPTSMSDWPTLVAA
jgi:hypothetical protein